MLNQTTPGLAPSSASTTNLRSTLVDLNEVNENHLYQQNQDVVYVCVIHGKKTSLALCAIEWVGSLISLALVLDAGVPEGSAIMLLAEIMLFFSCWLFLLPAFVKVRHALKRLVFLVSLWSLVLSVFLFVTAALVSNAFDQCQGVDTATHTCSKLQAAISITFITSFATLGTFVVLFLSSIKPPEMTFKSYIKSNFKRGGGEEGEFENVPLSQVRSVRPRPSANQQQQRAHAERGVGEDEESGLNDYAEDPSSSGRRLDAFEII